MEYDYFQGQQDVVDYYNKIKDVPPKIDPFLTWVSRNRWIFKNLNMDPSAENQQLLAQKKHISYTLYRYQINNIFYIGKSTSTITRMATHALGGRPINPKPSEIDKPLQDALKKDPDSIIYEELNITIKKDTTILKQAFQKKDVKAIDIYRNIVNLPIPEQINALATALCLLNTGDMKKTEILNAAELILTLEQYIGFGQNLNLNLTNKKFGQNKSAMTRITATKIKNALEDVSLPDEWNRFINGDYGSAVWNILSYHNKPLQGQKNEDFKDHFFNQAKNVIEKTMAKEIDNILNKSIPLKNSFLKIVPDNNKKNNQRNAQKLSVQLQNVIAKVYDVIKMFITNKSIQTALLQGNTSLWTNKTSDFLAVAKAYKNADYYYIWWKVITECQHKSSYADYWLNRWSLDVTTGRHLYVDPVEQKFQMLTLEKRVYSELIKLFSAPDSSGVVIAQKQLASTALSNFGSHYATFVKAWNYRYNGTLFEEKQMWKYYNMANYSGSFTFPVLQ